MHKLTVALWAGVAAWGQTQVDLRTQTKDVDFTAASSTSPVKDGATLPATCGIGNLFFLTSALAGQNLYACTAANIWTLQSGGGGAGAMTIEANGFVVGTRPTLNFIPGAGILDVLADTGTQINIQQLADTAVVQTRAVDQSGANLLCASASGSASAYTCAMNSTLQTYSSGMVLRWIPDVSGAGGPTSLNVDALGSRPIRLADGVTDPTTADVLAGRVYQVWYDGASLRLVAPPMIVGFTGTVQPSCSASQRGRIWQTFGGTGVKDSVTVCAKDGTDAYAWRVIY
jgi:hypothetical protein